MIDATTLGTLAEFPQRLETHFAAIPARFAHWTPLSWSGIPSEPFTALEQVCHIRDIEIDGYHTRFARVLEESNPDLPDIDGAALAHERSYATSDAVQAFAQFRRARTYTASMIASWRDADLRRPAIFEGRPASLRSLVHQLCSHDQQHLAGLQWLLAQLATQH